MLEASPISFGEGNCKGQDKLGNNGVLLHGLEVLCGNNITVSSGGDEHVSPGCRIFHGRDLEPSHRGLESVNGINFCDEDTGTIGPQRLGALEQGFNEAL